MVFQVYFFTDFFLIDLIRKIQIFLRITLLIHVTIFCLKKLFSQIIYLFNKFSAHSFVIAEKLKNLCDIKKWKEKFHISSLFIKKLIDEDLGKSWRYKKKKIIKQNFLKSRLSMLIGASLVQLSKYYPWSWIMHKNA